jgi:CRISPR-associated protein Cas5h
MEVLQIDLKGKMAHFRKYYANNTAMSFSIPPRTTLMGMLAALLGLPKDEYYSSLASDKMRIGVALLSPIKKSFHRLNFLSIKSLGNLKTDFEKERAFTSDFRGTGGHIQTPFEIITGYQLQDDEVWYRIYVSYFEEGKNTFEQLKTYMLNQQSHYNLSFGIACFSAYVSKVKCYQENEIEKCKSDNQIIEFNSAIVSDKISALKFEKQDNYSFVEEELMPADFVANQNRELSKMNRVIFTHNALPLRVAYSGNYYVLGQTQTITFLENA